MNKIKFTKFSIVIIIIIFITNCATYWNQRKKDFQDIFTAGVETPGVGAGVRVSFLTAGFVFQGGESSPGKKDKGTGYGLRGGSFGKYRSQQLIFGIMGGETFYSGDPILDEDGKPSYQEKNVVLPDERDNIKSHDLRYLDFYRDPPIERRKRNKEKIRKAVVTEAIENTGNEEYLAYLPKEKKKPYGYPNSYLYQFEIYGSIYGGVRIGFNVAELFDFILGFTTYDLLEDDTPRETE